MFIPSAPLVGKPDNRRTEAMNKLNGKVAIITGGSTGIGLATAKLFVAEGAHVFITGRRAAELEKARREIGKDVTVVQGDVANLEDLDRLYEAVKREKGVVHVVVANAGMVEPTPIDAATPEHYDRTFGVNARGAYFTVQKALPLMTEGGSVIFVSSGMHSKGIPAHTTYAASKAAVRSFVRTLAIELSGRKIRVNNLSPGVIDTPINQNQPPETMAFFKSITPLGRLGRPEELASCALFLASDDSSFVTASDLVADGGVTGV
jgi:NAD(P)-dependent dehydrogenase (short-subunit alcohol dehydrogenase family)